ncbi:MAG: DUF262 domain-containing protein [Deltaproteobacteria bacterium]|nr:DUF262 domain-containing protein [Candidatus Desulfobacula maris]
MDINLEEITIRELIDGYQDNREDGVVGYGGRLDIRPPYQREFIYEPAQRDAVIDTVTKGFPLNVMYWAVRGDGNFEVIDGQQRTISIAQYVKGDFSFKDRYFHNLQKDEQEQIYEYKLMIYFCSGTDSERLDWFKTINIAGEELSDQELRNAVYHGSWVTDAKRYFSKRGCPAYQIGNGYLSGKMIRQEYLETTIKWLASIEDKSIEKYMAKHQHKSDASELWTYFQSVIDWIEKVFPKYRKEMKGLDWGCLYRKYSDKSYDLDKVSKDVERLYKDVHVENRKGIFEYILGGSVETKLLNIRLFDDSVKRKVYLEQTERAEKEGVSNCPLCTIGHDANKSKIWDEDEMDADHVTAWSKGGATDEKNCQMLCKTHNKVKGNK